MTKYTIYIKSHADAPDYEDACIARSKMEAVRIFQGRLGKGGQEWGIEELLRNMKKERGYYCDMCKKELTTQQFCEKCRKNPMRSVLMAYGGMSAVEADNEIERLKKEKTV